MASSKKRKSSHKRRHRSGSRKKLSVGVHCVRIKKIGTRKVRVTRSGKWKFMKGKCRS